MTFKVSSRASRTSVAISSKCVYLEKSMKNQKPSISIISLYFFILSLGIPFLNGYSDSSANAEVILTNERYSIEVTEDSLKIVITEISSGARQSFMPSFAVLYNATQNEPRMSSIHLDIEDIRLRVPTWGNRKGLFKAGSLYKADADSAYFGKTVIFHFPPHEKFKLAAVLSLPEGELEPVLEFDLEAVTSGYFSVGYNGAPVYHRKEIDELWQPSVWTELRFPKISYLSPAFICPLPTSLVTEAGVTYGVVVHPEDFPFTPMPTSLDRSEFGVAVRNASGRVQPMIWAPILGLSNSLLRSGESYNFRLRLFVSEGNINIASESIAKRLFAFNEYKRTNVLGSLNTTLDNLIDYGMDSHSRFIPSLKGCSYQTDVPGGVKNVSSLNPLNIAFVTDNASIFRQRALPIMEFMLSRTRNTFLMSDFSFNRLGSPVAHSSELAALYSISGKASGFLLRLAKERAVNLESAHEQTMRDNLGLFRASGSFQYLQNANSGAAIYISDRIDQMQEDFLYLHHNNSSFWVGLAPKFIDLMELYEATGNNQLLEAAHEAARRYTRYIWMSPKIPDQDIAVNLGNQAPFYRDNGYSISVPEETVPAWRISAIGLHSEAAPTSTNKHRAVFMAHHAPYMLRIAAQTGDEYLGRIARNAILGRYTTFPGYHMNTDRTTVYEKPDFPYRSHEELNSTTSMHYNHVWPMMSLLLDYLVTDVYVKSDGQIFFPSEYSEGYANLQNKIYGHRPGQLYEEQELILWMPQRMLESSHQELNYIAARGNGKLYIVFTNQSSEPVSSVITLNENVMPFDLSTSYSLEIWEENSLTGSSSLANGGFQINVAADGITAVAIEGVNIPTTIQDNMLANTVENRWWNDYRELNYANAKAMIINFGDHLTRAYIYSAAPYGMYSEMRLEYAINDTGRTPIYDYLYPFEFSVPLSPNSEKIVFKLIAKSSDGETTESEQSILSVKMPVTAELTGDQAILRGEEADLRINLSGSPPWNITYTDGEDEFDVNGIQQTPFEITVSPLQTTTYTLLTVSDVKGLSSASGSVTITVGDEFLVPFFDGMVRQYWNDGEHSLTYFEVKHDPNWAREAFLSFDMAELSNPVENAMLRIYCYNGDVAGPVTFNIECIEQVFGDTLAWFNKPANAEFKKAGTSIVRSKTDVNTYFTWDVTDYLNELIQKEVKQFSLRIDAVDGIDCLFKFKANEDSSEYSPKLIIETEGSTNLEDPSLIVPEYSLQQNYPNPFNPSTTIEYSLKEPVQVSLVIYDVRGQELRKLIDAFQTSGYKSVVWDGKNKVGIPVANGLYLYRLTAGKFVWVRKMIVLK